MTRRVLWIGVALIAALGCGKKKDPGKEKPPAPDEPDPVEVASGPTSAPDLPAQVALDCGRLVPEPVRAAHLAGLTVEEETKGSTLSCRFTGGMSAPSVAFFCHDRKRSWDFEAILARDPSKKAVAGVGRAAYARRESLFFYPSKLDCLVRVWHTDPARAADIARALDPLLSKDSVTGGAAP